MLLLSLFLFKFSPTQSQPGSQLAVTQTPPPSPIATSPAEATSAPAESTPTEASPEPVETPVSPQPSTASAVRQRPGERLRPASTSPPSAPDAYPSQGPTTADTTATTTEPKPPIVREIAASSQLNDEYRPNLAFDGNSATAWAPKPRNAEQTLFVHFKSPSVVKSVSVLNGDGRDEQHYKESNRIRTLRLVLSDGTNQLLTFKDEMKMQRFELKQPVTADWAKVLIVSVFPGKTKRTVISEVAFNEPERGAENSEDQ